MQVSQRPSIFPFRLVAMCVWGVLLYSNTLHAPFVFDDERFIVENPMIRNITDGTLWNRLNQHRRYVAFLSFGLNYHFHGTSVAGYHWVNLGIHLANSLLVVWLVLLLFNTVRIRKDKLFEHRYLIALFSAWLFLAHPIQTQAVSYITQRFESLAAFFYVLSVCLYVRGRMARFPKNLGLLVLSALSAVLGILTKETVFSLPLALILIECLFFRPAQTGSGKVRWVYVGIFFLGCVQAASVFFDIPKIFSQFNNLGITSHTYLFTQFQVILKYIRLLFFPYGQNVDYNFPLASGSLDALTLASLAGVLFVLFSGFWLCRRAPLIGFGILWFFVTLSVTSSIIPLPDLISEHRLYLPSVGVAIAFCVALLSFLKNTRMFVACMACIILLFSYLTYQRNIIWHDDLALWSDAVAKAPPSARIYNNLGYVHLQQGNYQKAVDNYLFALTCPMDTVIAARIYGNLGAAYEMLGDHEKGIAHFLKALELNPKNLEAHSNLAYAYIAMRDYEKALESSKKAIEIYPDYEAALINVGVAYKNMGEYEKALEYYERALKVNPRSVEAKNNLIRTRSLMQRRSIQ